MRPATPRRRPAERSTSACPPPPPPHLLLRLQRVHLADDQLGARRRDPERLSGSDDLPGRRQLREPLTTSVSKASHVTVQPVAGATATIGAVNFNNVNHLHFTGTGGSMSIGGLHMDITSGTSNNLTFDQ